MSRTQHAKGATCTLLADIGHSEYMKYQLLSKVFL